MGNMERQKTQLLFEYLVVSAILIFTSFSKYKLIGMLIVITYLGVERVLRKRTKNEIGFNIKAVFEDLKKTWLFIAIVVIVTPLISVYIGKLFVPEYYSHVLNRVSPYVDFSKADKIISQLLVLALGEEIVFRAFLQGRLSKFINPNIAIITASVVFAGVHYSPDSLQIVALDLASVFIDSILFGIIFARTNNVVVSTIAHFLGNSFSLMVLILLNKGNL